MNSPPNYQQTPLYLFLKGALTDLGSAEVCIILKVTLTTTKTRQNTI